MRKNITLAIFIHCIVGSVLGQDLPKMAQLWLTKASFKIDQCGYSSDLNLLHASNEKNLLVADPVSGNILWSKAFKEISDQISKVDIQIPIYQSKSMILFDKKMGKDKMVVVDLITGIALWSSDKYQGVSSEDEIIYVPEMEAFAVVTDDALSLVKTKTGEEIWKTEKMNNPIAKYLIDKKEMSITILNMSRTLLGFATKGFKNQLLKIDLKTGKIIFDMPYYGKVEKKYLTREILAKMWQKDEYLILQFKGIQVYNSKTGSLVWKSTYDVSFDDIPGVSFTTPGKRGLYGAIADPIFDGNNVYLLDVKNRRSQYLKKFELSTGKMLWESKEIKEADILPNMYLVNDMLVLQSGGYAEAQYTMERKVNNMVTSYNRNIMLLVKPCNLRAINPSTGADIWMNKLFESGISNSFLNKNNLVVCGLEEFYSLNAVTGKEAFKISLKKDDTKGVLKILDPNTISGLTNKNNVIIIGYWGVSSYDLTNGKKNWSVSTDMGVFEGIYGSTLFYKKENQEEITININTGKATIFEAENKTPSFINKDGKFLYSYDGKELMKLQAD
jgi:outer membrane protein assembly factor BamB